MRVGLLPPCPIHQPEGPGYLCLVINSKPVWQKWPCLQLGQCWHRFWVY